MLLLESSRTKPSSPSYSTDRLVIFVPFVSEIGTLGIACPSCQVWSGILFKPSSTSNLNVRTTLLFPKWPSIAFALNEYTPGDRTTPAFLVTMYFVLSKGFFSIVIPWGTLSCWISKVAFDLFSTKFPIICFWSVEGIATGVGFETR